jgi:hypothetical protein
VIIRCLVCAAEFYIRPCRFGTAKFCSLLCRDVYLRKRNPLVCAKCGETKTPKDFNKDRYKHGGFGPRCKQCCSSRQRDIFRFMPSRRESEARGNAKRRGLEWTITKEQFLSFWQKPCTYCGDAIETVGLDRVDNAKGYTLENVTSCCGICNSMKSGMTVAEFLERCSRIANQAIACEVPKPDQAASA